MERGTTALPENKCSAAEETGGKGININVLLIFETPMVEMNSIAAERGISV